MSIAVEQSPAMILESLIYPEISAVMKQLSNTSERLAQNVPGQLFANVPQHHQRFHNGIDLVPDVCVTDQPCEIFGKAPEAYTITSTLALDTIETHGLLATNQLAKHKIPTHRGIGLSLLTRFAKNLGMNTINDKDHWVWMGRKLDPEQFVLDDQIAKNPTNDQQILELFFDSKSKPQNLHPSMIRVLDLFSNGETPYEDALLCEYCDKFLDGLFYFFGTRDGWYKKFSDVFTGQRQVPAGISSKDIQHQLLYVLTFNAHSAPNTSHAMIAQIDWMSLATRDKLYMFPASDRPPHATIPSDEVPFDYITAFYVHENEHIPRNVSPRVRQKIHMISDQPRDVWLSGPGRQPVQPSEITASSINRFSPLCLGRYQAIGNHADAFDAWARAINAGLMAPYQYLGTLGIPDTNHFLYFHTAMERAIEQALDKSDKLPDILKILNTPEKFRSYITATLTKPDITHYYPASVRSYLD